MKKLLLMLAVATVLRIPVLAAGPEVNARAALLMEKSTGQVLYEKDARQTLEPASVTKVMTLLLIQEALDRGDLAKDTEIPVSARAFIRSTKASSLPARYSAMATQASLAEATAMALSISSAVRTSPSFR